MVSKEPALEKDWQMNVEVRASRVFLSIAVRWQCKKKALIVESLLKS
jgi:hypothetical protein